MTFKEFWTSKSVMISVAIFVSVLLIMGIIALISVTTSCTSKTDWLKDSQPVVRYYSSAKKGSFVQQWFTVSNPTTAQIKGELICENSETISRVKKSVTLPPMTNMLVGMVLPNGAYECKFNQ